MNQNIILKFFISTENVEAYYDIVHVDDNQNKF